MKKYSFHKKEDVDRMKPACHSFSSLSLFSQILRMTNLSFCCVFFEEYLKYCQQHSAIHFISRKIDKI